MNISFEDTVAYPDYAPTKSKQLKKSNGVQTDHVVVFLFANNI
jgi:hypothetical protein